VGLSIVLSRVAIVSMVFTVGRMGFAFAIAAFVFSTRASGLGTTRGYNSDVVASRGVMHGFVEPDVSSSPRTLLWQERRRGGNIPGLIRELYRLPAVS